MKPFLTFFACLFMLGACSPNYKISVEPPECAENPSHSECQEHQTKPVLEHDEMGL